MIRRHTTGALRVLVCGAILSFSANGWANSGAPQNQNVSYHFTSFQTYLPSEFHTLVIEHLLEFCGVNARRFPYRAAVDSQERILVTDPGLSVVHVLDVKNRAYWQIIGDRHQRLGVPVGIAVDADDNIYVTDLSPPRIVVFHPGGRIVRVIGAAVLEAPAGLSVDKQSRELYVADESKDQILSFDLEGRLVGSFGSRGAGPGQFIRPRDVVLHHKTLVVLDAGNFRLQMFDLRGMFRGMWPLGADQPSGLVFDHESNLYYVDQATSNLVALDRRGKFLATVGRRKRLFGEPDFYCAQVNAEGDIVAIRSPFRLQMLRLVPDTAP